MIKSLHACLAGVCCLALAVTVIARPPSKAATPPQKASAEKGEITLKVGDPAPKIEVSKWVKGTDQSELKSGNVYVVEFWATWCGPCKAAIPHVTELAHKYKDKGLTVIGVAVWERDPSKVEPFVKEMGDKMDYNVAMDDTSAGKPGKMAANWLQAAGRNGIPCSFIVGRDGKIAWIGHPMQMEAELEKAINNQQASAK